MVVIPAEIVLIVFLVIFVHILMYYLLTRKKKSIDNKHVLVTGGSSGIGLWAAIYAARLGANVTIIARNERLLEKAALVIKENCVHRNQKVEWKSCDLTKGYEVISSAFTDIEESMGDIYMLVNCAGQAICGAIEDVSEKDAKFMMDLNYFGTYNPIKYVLPKMKARKDGIIVLTSSQAGLLGIYGYGPYAAAKFALRGLAETLTMEVKHLGIFVTLALPADTDTPGFAQEEKSKPIETKLISGSGGLAKPEDVANRLIKDALKGSFFSILGLESYILSIMCVGMAPWYNPFLAFAQFYFMGILRLIGLVINWNFGRIVRKCHNSKDKDQ